MNREFIAPDGRRLRIVNKIGQRHGRLTVIAFAGQEGGAKCALWKCQCDCGNITILASRALYRNGTKSCGCLQKDRQMDSVCLPEGEGALRSLFAEYKRDAARRGYAFRLEKGQFRDLIQQNCFYCGAPPSKRHERADMNGGIDYNGIDRKHNSSGYTPENCVPCCWECNQLKGTRNAKDFIQHVTRIARHTGVF